MTTTDDKINALADQVAALTRMLGVVCDAPALKSHVKQQERVAEIKAQVAHAERFASTSSADRLAMLEAMGLRKARDFVKQLGVRNLVDLVRGLDDAQRATFARFLDDSTRATIACRLSAIGVLEVALPDTGAASAIDLPGDSQADEPSMWPMKIRRSDPAFVLASDWDARLATDEFEHVDVLVCSGQLVVRPADEEIAWGVREQLLASHRLILDGAFNLEPSKLVLSKNPNVSAQVVPLRELEAEACEAEAPEPDDPNRGAKLANEWRARQRAERDAHQAAIIASAITTALGKNAVVHS